MILAAPLVIPFAQAVGLSVGTLGMAALADQVNDYIQDNPEESMKILSTIIPNVGIGQIFMSKEDKISLEDLDEMTDEEAQDLTKEEKAELMKQAGKSGGKNKRQTMIDISEKLGLSGPGREKQDIEYEVDERYDEGGVEEVSKPKFDYTKFFRKRRADGGAIGVESLFEERTPFRFGGRGYQGGRNTGVSRGGGRSAAMGMGGKQRGGTFSAPTPTGGGGPSGTGSTKKVSPIKKIGSGIDKTLSFISPFVDPTSKFGKGLGIYNVLKKGAQTIGNTLFTPAGAAEMTLEDLKNLGAVEKGFFGDKLTDKGKALEEFRETATKFKFSKNPAKTPQAALDFITDPARTGLYGKSDIVKEKDFIQTAIDKGFLAEEKDYGLQKPLDEYLADGGRVGFNVGGITDPQALAIYNSMNAYGFSDQEIADAITAQGYDAGTLGQTTTPTPPTTPTPSEGIIGIDLQQRDTGGGFNPFGPLDSTFTRDLTDVDMYKGVNVEGLTPFQQMQKFKTATQDNMFGLGKFFQPKIRGTLGNRLQRQFQTGQKLPSFAAAIAGAQSPFNIDSKNYNPDFVDQLNYLELGDGLIGMSSVGLKYGPESVLSGKNVISGFGTNNYQKALEKFIAKTKSDKRRKQGEIELQNFLNAEKARKERERKEKEAIAEAARRTQYGPIDYGKGSDGQQSYDFGQGFGIGATTGGPVSNRTGRGRQDYSKGGLASMFAEKR